MIKAIKNRQKKSVAVRGKEKFGVYENDFP